MVGNSQPALDDCSAGKGAGLATFSGRNIGDLMNAAGVTLGLVRGRLQADLRAAGGDAVCAGSTRTPPARASPTTSRTTSRSSTTPRPPTAHHLPPTSVDAIGIDRPGQPPVRPERLRRRAGRRQPAAGLVPEGRLGRGRAPRLLRPARRAALHRARAQRAPAVAGVGLDRGLPRLRRLRRLVRPRVPPAAAGLATSRATRSTAPACCGPAPGAGRLPGPLRARPAPAAAGRLAVGEAELHRPHADRADLDHRVHRGQLEPRADRRLSPSTTRAAVAEQHVRLRPGTARAEAVLDPQRSAPGRCDPPTAPTRPDPATATAIPTATPTATADRDADADADTAEAQGRGQAELQGQRRRQADHGLLHRPAARTRAKTTAAFQIIEGQQDAGDRARRASPRRRRRSPSSPKKAIKAGKYTLRITLTQSGRTRSR